MYAAIHVPAHASTKTGLTVVALVAALMLPLAADATPALGDTPTQADAAAGGVAAASANQTQRAVRAEQAQIAWERQSAAMRAEHARINRERTALRALYERVPAEGDRQLTADERSLMRSYYESLGAQMTAKEAVYRQRLAAHQEVLRQHVQDGNSTFDSFAQRQRTSAQSAVDDMTAASRAREQRRQAVRLQAQRADAARALGQSQAQVRRAEARLDRNNQQLDRIVRQNEQRHAQIDAQRKAYSERANQLSTQADALFAQRNQAQARGDHVAAGRLHQQGHALLQQAREASGRGDALHHNRAIISANARKEQIWQDNERAVQSIAQGRPRVEQLQAQVNAVDAQKAEFNRRLKERGMTMNARGQIVPISNAQAQTQAPTGRPAATAGTASTAARQQQERELAQAQDRLAALERQSQALAADAAARGWVSVR